MKPKIKYQCSCDKEKGAYINPRAGKNQYFAKNIYIDIDNKIAYCRGCEKRLPIDVPIVYEGCK